MFKTALIVAPLIAFSLSNLVNTAPTKLFKGDKNQYDNAVDNVHYENNLTATQNSTVTSLSSIWLNDGPEPTNFGLYKRKNFVASEVPTDWNEGNSSFFDDDNHYHPVATSSSFEIYARDYLEDEVSPTPTNNSYTIMENYPEYTASVIGSNEPHDFTSSPPPESNRGRLHKRKNFVDSEVPLDWNMDENYSIDVDGYGSSSYPQITGPSPSPYSEANNDYAYQIDELPPGRNLLSDFESVAFYNEPQYSQVAPTEPIFYDAINHFGPLRYGPRTSSISYIRYGFLDVDSSDDEDLYYAPYQTAFVYEYLPSEYEENMNDDFGLASEGDESESDEEYIPSRFMDNLNLSEETPNQQNYVDEDGYIYSNPEIMP